VTVHKLIKKYQPQSVVIDPISNLVSVGSLSEVRSMLTRLIDFLKVSDITALFTALVSARDGRMEMTEEGVSSLVDTWLSVRDLEGIGERNRGLSILKARGMSHSNQVREFVVTDHGIQLLDVVIGPLGIITGAGRLTQRMQEQAQLVAQQHELSRRDRELERKRRVLEATINNLRTEFESVEEELRQVNNEEHARHEALSHSAGPKPTTTTPAASGPQHSA
jgi:circadian clock protein KaiC